MFIYNCYTFSNVFESLLPRVMPQKNYLSSDHALLLFRWNIPRPFIMLFPFQIRSQKLPFINILSRNIILERILRTLAVRFQAPRLETIQVSDAIVGRTEKLESSIFACLCIAPFSWFLCRSLAEHVESCHGWIYYPIHHSVSVGLPSAVIVNKETIQTSQLVPYNSTCFRTTSPFHQRFRATPSTSKGQFPDFPLHSISR